MNLLDFFLNLVLGMLLGALGGLFGIGGGLLAIPALGVLFDLDQQLAQGTALAMVVPNVLLALWRYHQRNRIDRRHALTLAASALLWALLGATWAVTLDAGRMRLAFIGFLVVLALYNFSRVYWRTPAGASALRHPWPWLALLGSGAGLLGGLFGVGGAVLATPLLTALFGTTQLMAQGLSLALAAPSTAVTLATYAWHGQVNWTLAVPLALGGLLSISWGVRVAHGLPERRLRALFAGFLLFCALLLGVKA